MTNEAVRRVLLVDDDERARRTRALMLVTHGYTVDTIGSLRELDHAWERERYGLVLLSMTSGMKGELGSWKSIQREHPTQEFMFLLSASARLCPLFLDGDQVRDEEWPDSFLPRVQAAFAAS